EHRLRVQYLGCSDCARRRASRSRRRSAAHRAGQDRRLLCGPTRQHCARPFGQGQFHLAVLISALPRKGTYLPILELLPPPTLRERRHRGLARLRMAVRGACDFSWMANADHGKAACATLLPKPDLPKSVSHKPSAVANRLLSRERGC